MTPRKRPTVPAGREAVLVAGVRTPFLRSNGAYQDVMAHDLARHALTGLIAKSGIEPALVDLVVMGTVVQDPRTSNLAREAALGANLPERSPSYTVTLACISANVAATNVVEQIRGGHIDVGVAGGAETFSDPPIRVSKKVRKALVKTQKAKGAKDYLAILSELSPKDIGLDIPSASEFSTGLTMGASCERLARRFGVTREESDDFAIRSHVLADRAWKEGLFADEVVPVQLPPDFAAVEKDDGPRGDSSKETLAKLKPAFDKSWGVLTAASSSFLTDGASAVLLMAREQAARLGVDDTVVVRDYVYGSGNPLEELLLGPAFTIPQILDRNGLSVDDVDVWEIHEAFAAQMVANLKALASDSFAKERLGRQSAIAPIPMDKLNVWGGSLSLGHPFGATGGRLLSTAAHRLRLGGKRFAVVAGCAAGGQGSAILLERNG